MGDFKNLSKFLEEVVEKHGPAGNSCMVMQDGKVLFEEYHGLQDKEKGIPTDENTLYRQFSTTKISTCVGALTLFEQGKYLMNDPLSEYIPEWKDATIAQYNGHGGVDIRKPDKPILIRDCFTMAMGLGYGGMDITHTKLQEVRAELSKRPGGYSVVDEIRAIPAVVPMAFEPGTHFLYGLGHDILAALVEIISGQRFCEYLKENIFEPLGMENTAHHFFGDAADRLTPCYDYDPATGAIKLGEPPMFDKNFAPDAPYDGGGAGLFSNVRDYSRLMQMLACGGEVNGTRILGRKTIDMMRTNRLNEQQMKDFTNKYLDGFGYGYGVRTLIDKAPGNNASIGTFGWTGAAGTLAEADPEEKLSIVYMHNMLPNNEEYIHPRIRNIVYSAIK